MDKPDFSDYSEHAQNYRRQELFDKVVIALVKQGKPAIMITTLRSDEGETVEDATCVYFADDGSRCAVGHLLSGDLLEYAKGFVGGVDSLTNSAATDKGLHLYSQLGLAGSSMNEQFLCDLQVAHDRGHCELSWLTQWFTRMRKIAETYSLTPKVLDEAIAKLEKKEEKEVIGNE